MDYQTYLKDANTLREREMARAISYGVNLLRKFTRDSNEAMLIATILVEKGSNAALAWTQVLGQMSELELSEVAISEEKNIHPLNLDAFERAFADEDEKDG